MTNTPDAQVRAALVRDLGLQGAIRYAERIANTGGEFADQYRRIGEGLQVDEMFPKTRARLRAMLAEMEDY